MIYLVVGLCLAIPVLCFLAFVEGYNVGRRVETGRDLPMPFKLPARPRKETAAERIQRLTAQNVENYGTAAPQQEVK